MTSSTKIELRLATNGDLEAIREIYNHAILHTTAVYSYEPYTHEEIIAWYNSKQEGNFPVIVATQNDKVTGFVTFGPFRVRPAYKYTVEHSIYVHPDYRRQGIARQLMTRIIDEAIKADKHVLIGGIDAENETSVRFHREFGFEDAGTIKEAGYKFNRWLDLKFMQLTLKTPKHPTS